MEIVLKLLALSWLSRFCVSFAGVDDKNVVATTFVNNSAPHLSLTWVAC
jgi:hypothetical protein